MHGPSARLDRPARNSEAAATGQRPAGDARVTLQRHRGPRPWRGSCGATRPASAQQSMASSLLAAESALASRPHRAHATAPSPVAWRQGALQRVQACPLAPRGSKTKERHVSGTRAGCDGAGAAPDRNDCKSGTISSQASAQHARHLSDSGAVLRIYAPYTHRRSSRLCR